MIHSDPISIYFHWPFCESKCPYCDFNSHVRQAIEQQDWLLGYKRNIQKWFAKFKKPVIETIYFGGGTPSLMDPSVVSDLISNIYKYHSVSENIEVSLEANPSSVEIKKFKDYASAGINRISIGVQSFVDKDLKLLGRLHSAKEAISAIKTSLSIFDNVNFDLIYGRQYQELKDWEQELQFALSLGSQHLSLYQLTIENDTAFSMLFKKGKLKGLPTERLSRKFFLTTEELCTLSGLKHYEVSNYSLEGYECKHNLNYWRCGNFLGIGPGAHGRYQVNMNRYSYENIVNPETWLKKAINGNLPTNKETIISNMDHYEEYVIMGLRLREGISLKKVRKIFGIDFDKDKLNNLIVLGFVEIYNDRLKVLPKGRILLNQIVKELLV